MRTNLNINKVPKLLHDIAFIPEESNIRVFTRYHDNGEVELIKRSINGKLEGENQTFYKNGNIHCDLNYKEHELHGLCKGYYLHGTLALEILFDMGKAVHGFYYKKDGKKTLMTSVQLARKTERSL